MRSLIFAEITDHWFQCNVPFLCFDLTKPAVVQNYLWHWKRQRASFSPWFDLQTEHNVKKKRVEYSSLKTLKNSNFLFDVQGLCRQQDIYFPFISSSFIDILMWMNHIVVLSS